MGLILGWGSLQLCQSLVNELYMFSSPQENEPTTLTTKTFFSLSLPGVQRGVYWRISIQKSYHFIAFEPVNPILYIYFPSFECGIFWKLWSPRCRRLLSCDFVTKSHPKGDDEIEFSVDWFHKWIVAIKMKLPNSLPSQANVRIVEIK